MSAPVTATAKLLLSLNACDEFIAGVRFNDYTAVLNEKSSNFE
jgi:hypothetical protein